MVFVVTIHLLNGCIEQKINDSGVGSIAEPQEFDAIRQAIESDLQTVGMPNAMFVLFQDGEILYAEGWGTTASGDPIDEDTRFRIGSLTKPMTAASIHAQDLSLDIPVVDMVEGIDLFKSPDLIQDITLQHLLEHSAGLVDSLGSGTEATLTDFIENTFYNQGFIASPPGRLWNYSDLNYVLAGYVLQEAGGQSYADLMKASFFDPMNMSRTIFDPTNVQEEGNWSTGMDAETEIDASVGDVPYGWSTGFAWSTAADMANFGDFVLSGNMAVMTSEQHASFVSPRISMGLIDDKLQYGNGIMHYEGISSNAGWHDIDILFHNGSIPGYGAAFYLLPEYNAGFVSLVGATGVELPSAIIAAIRYFGLPEAIDFPIEGMALTDFSVYEGTYVDDWNVGEIVLTATPIGLEVEMPRLDAMGIVYNKRWRPYTKHNFLTTIDGTNVLIRFEMDEQGMAEFVVHRTFVGSRIE